MKPEDVPSLLRLQAECYSSKLLEDESTIRARLRLSPDSAWVAEDEGGLCAYLVTYRSVVGKVTPLGGPFDPMKEADCLYLHDLAVSSRCKGQGIGQALVQFACQTAVEEGFAYSALVSVQGSQAFWNRLGYHLWDGLEPAQLANLKTYEGPSAYMVRSLV